MINVPKAVLVVLCAGIAAGAPAQQRPSSRTDSVLPVYAPLPAPPYADYADLVLAAPLVIDSTIHGTSRLKPAEAPDVAPGKARLYVEVDVTALIRGTEPLPPRIGYLLDVPVDAKSRLPALKKLRVLLFARPAGPGQVQLVRPDAQRNWTPGGDELVRRITREVLASDAPPRITGVGHAFHTAGALPGEGETQIFLITEGGRPVSLSIDRAADGTRSWKVSLSDIVDAGAGPPPRDTLLWYRLACTLPAALPATSLEGAEPADAAIAREDYGYVRQALGRCDRGGAL
ncbi:hypothetical protein QH494_18315 [Sphingomonas sp. AR_OL41]|uniref:hypothetical protein n=1 Tax=Sphingomonas sp. AR_OL41 TaxID=3042729 RepID=UPI0024811A76|nr:hypothetical protein [Sphingomonas sp. AR_OL41]MDH7974147.1 hypothetical protein [Sphingomonas sp. AR_OL41]